MQLCFFEGEMAANYQDKKVSPSLDGDTRLPSALQDILEHADALSEENSEGGVRSEDIVTLKKEIELIRSDSQATETKSDQPIKKGKVALLKEKDKESVTALKNSQEPRQLKTTTLAQSQIVHSNQKNEIPTSGPDSSKIANSQSIKRNISPIFNEEINTSHNSRIPIDSDIPTRVKDFLKSGFTTLSEGIFSRQTEISTPQEKTVTFIHKNSDNQSEVNLSTQSNNSTNNASHTSQRDDNLKQVAPTQSSYIQEASPSNQIKQSYPSQLEQNREPAVSIKAPIKEDSQVEVKKDLPLRSAIEVKVSDKLHIEQIKANISTTFEAQFRDKTGPTLTREVINEIVLKSPEITKFVESIKSYETNKNREILPQVINSIPEAVRMSTERYISLSQGDHKISPVDLKLLIPETVERLSKLHGLPVDDRLRVIDPRLDPKPNIIHDSSERLVAPQVSSTLSRRSLTHDPQSTPQVNSRDERQFRQKEFQPVVFNPSPTSHTPLESQNPNNRIASVPPELLKSGIGDQNPNFKPSESVVPPIKPIKDFNIEKESKDENRSNREETSNSPESDLRDGYNPLGVLEEREKFLKILKVHTITGIVTDKSGGRGVPGVFVSGGILGNAMTNLAGEFSFSNVPNGQVYTLGLSKNGYKIAPSTITATAYGPNHHQFTGEDVTIRGKKKGLFNRFFISDS